MKTIFNQSLILLLFVGIILISCEKNTYPETETETETETELTAIDGYIAIYTAAQLASIGNSSDYPLNGNFILMNNIDLSDYSDWTPIGSWSEEYSSSPFSGTFDGANNVISNLTINSSSSNKGLFGYVEDGSILNLILKNPQVKGAGYVGAICGRICSTSEDLNSFKNCSVEDGAVSGTNYSSVVGGLVGYAENCTFSSCYNTSSVSISSKVGGIVGYASSSIITSCYNTGKISGMNSGYNIGGIVGYADHSLTVTDCYNTGDVSGDGPVGGIVGYAYSEGIISSCYNTGSVSGSESKVGGIVGSTTDSYVVDCDNNGNVSGSENMVGGVVGYAGTAVTNCFNTGSVSGSGNYIGGVVGCTHHYITSCYNTGNILGTGFSVGGIAGEANSYSSPSSSYKSSIVSCYNTGDVSGSNVNVGGIVGEAGSAYGSSPTVTPEASSFIIKACYNTGNVLSDNNFTGGIVGRSVVSSTAATTSVTITSCYNIGIVCGVGDYVGGVTGIAYTTINVNSCYYLPYDNAIYTNNYGTEDADLASTMTSVAIIKTLNTAADDTYWISDSKLINNGYPILLSFSYD